MNTLGITIDNDVNSMYQNEVNILPLGKSIMGIDHNNEVYPIDNFSNITLPYTNSILDPNPRKPLTSKQNTTITQT